MSIKGAWYCTSLLRPTQVYPASLSSKRLYFSITATQLLLSQQIIRVNNQNKIQTSHTKIHLDLFPPEFKNVSLPENNACQHGWKRLYSLLRMGLQKPVGQKGRQVQNLWHSELKVLYPNIRWFQVASIPGISGSFDILLTDSRICWRCIRFRSKHIMETFIIVWVVANSIVGKHRMMLGALANFFY